MAVNEALELVEALQTKTKVSAAAIIVNRVPSEIFTKSQEIVFSQLNQVAVKSFIVKKTGSSIDLSLQA